MIYWAIASGLAMTYGITEAAVSYGRGSNSTKGCTVFSVGMVSIMACFLTWLFS